MVLALPFSQQQQPGIAIPTIGYSAEDDIGLIPFDDSLQTRTDNTIKFNSALDSMHYNGAFTFADGSVGNVLMPIIFPGKTFYFLPPIKTSTKMSGAIFGTGGSGYEMLDGQYTWAPGVGGMRTRIVGVNELGDEEPVFRIRCNGFGIYGIDFYGREMTTWDSNGPRAVACIQVEGSASTNPGRASIRDCNIFEAKYGIQTLAGYYDGGGSFHSDANHADLSIVDNVNFFNVESAFRSECLQSIGWSFKKVCMETVGNNAPAHGIIFDVIEGGFFLVNDVIINHGTVTLLRLYGYSPHNCCFDINGVYWDRAPAPNKHNYLTLIKYDGSSYYEAGGNHPYRVRISGGLGDHDLSRWDYQKLFYFNPDNIPAFNDSDIYVDLLNLPSDILTAGTGPYYSLDSDIVSYRSQLQKISVRYRLDESSGTSAVDDMGTGIDATLNGSTNWTTKSVSNASWSSSVATFTTSSNHPYKAGHSVKVYGVDPSGYDGTYTVSTVGSNTFTVPLVSNPGTYVSGGTVKMGIEEGALAFTNSSSDYMTIPAGSSTNLYVNSSITFWIYLNAWAAGVIMSRTESGVADKNGFRIEVSPNKFLVTEGGINHVDFVNQSAPFTTGAWFHIAVTLDGTNTYKAYINGVEAVKEIGTPGTMTSGKWLSNTGVDTRVGAPTLSFFGSGSASANMVLDDIRLYKRVLPPEAIDQLYNFGL